MRRLLAASLAVAAGCVSTPPPLPPPPVSEVRTIATARGRIAIDDGGAGGLPVLLVHGEGGDKTIWRDQLDHLRKSRRAIAIDLPGFGGSDAPRDADWTPVALGEDLGRVADALGITRFVLVVHGFSGTLGISYAARHPLRVAGLYLLEAHGGRIAPRPLLEAERAAFAPDRLPQTVRERYEPLLVDANDGTRARVLEALERTSRQGHLAAAGALLTFDPVAGLKAYPGPRFALAAARHVLAGIPGNVEKVPYKKVEGASHWIMLDRPEEVNAALDEFLAKVK
jgi:pimeloyl-ACP methyl ester carboxylesterase